MKTLITHATIINEGRRFTGSVLLRDEVIEAVYGADDALPEADRVVDATGLWLVPGVIDDQVHFRDPGLTHKGDIRTESRAAVAGGVTSVMDMPNTKPPATTLELLEAKYRLGAEKSLANYSFLLGATNDNLAELKRVDARRVAGVKLFMGSSTGNMLVDDERALAAIFAETPCLIAAHCEDEATIRRNTNRYLALQVDDLPMYYHPLIRSAEACYRSSAKAVEMAGRYGARLHVFHLSTGREMSLFDPGKPLADKRITAEVCVHHLWFSDEDYDYDYFVDLDYGDDGTVNAVRTNMARINALSSELLSDIVHAADGGELSLSIPIGNVLGSSLLLGKGPDIPVDITMLSSSHVDFQNELSDAGINQTKHQIKLEVVIDIDVIMPWKTVSTQVISEILIAETVILGDVPDTYLNWGNTN